MQWSKERRFLWKILIPLYFNCYNSSNIKRSKIIFSVTEWNKFPQKDVKVIIEQFMNKTRRLKIKYDWIVVFFLRVTVPTSPSLASGLGLSPAALPHLLSNSSASQQLLSAMQPQQLLQAAQAAQAQAAQAVQVAQASQQPLLTTSPQHHGHRHSSHINHYTVRLHISSFAE